MKKTSTQFVNLFSSWHSQLVSFRERIHVCGRLPAWSCDVYYLYYLPMSVNDSLFVGLQWTFLNRSAVLKLTYILDIIFTVVHIEFLCQSSCRYHSVCLEFSACASLSVAVWQIVTNSHPRGCSSTNSPRPRSLWLAKQCPCTIITETVSAWISIKQFFYVRINEIHGKRLGLSVDERKRFA